MYFYRKKKKTFFLFDLFIENQFAFYFTQKVEVNKEIEVEVQKYNYVVYMVEKRDVRLLFVGCL